MQAHRFRSDRELLVATSGSNHVTGVVISKIQKRRHRCDERVATLRKGVATISSRFSYSSTLFLIIREFSYLDFIREVRERTLKTFREEFQRLEENFNARADDLEIDWEILCVLTTISAIADFNFTLRFKCNTGCEVLSTFVSRGYKNSI